jgi:hypothetical protein
LEKGADAVKIAGNIRYHYTQNDGGDKSHANQLRSRLTFNGQVNEDWTYTALLEHNHKFQNDVSDESGTTWQRAYLSGKVGGADVVAGRYNAYFGDGYVYDTRADAVEASYNFGAVKATAFYGKGNDGYIYKETVAGVDKFYDTMGDYKAIELSTQALGLDVMAGYADFTDMAYTGSGVDNKIWWAQVGKSFGDFAVKATYLKGDLTGNEQIEKWTQDDDGYAFAVNYKGAKASEPGTWGLFANYWNQGGQTYIAHTTDAEWHAYEGFKGYGLSAQYALAKNIVLDVAWYDTESKLTGAEEELLYADVYFTF